MELTAELPDGSDDPAKLSVRVVDPAEEPFPNNARPKSTRGCRSAEFGVTRGITGPGASAGRGSGPGLDSIRSITVQGAGCEYLDLAYWPLRRKQL